MDNLSGESSIQIVSKEESLTAPQYVKNDVNLYCLPFFSNERWKPGVKDISLEIKDGDNILKWLVAPHQKWGSPAFFEKKVFYAFLSIIEEKGLPSPLVPFTFREILRRMGLPEKGTNIKNVKKAIDRIKFTGIVSEGTFYSKEKKTRVYDAFSLFDRVILKNETYTDPTTEENKKAETNFLVLGSWLYSNLKNGYIAKIDYHLFQKMKPLEARLYEFLLPNFYPIITGKSKDNFFKKSYSTLCKFLPTRPYEYESDIKRKFIVHIESLIKKGILSHYRVHCSNNHKKDKNFIFYFYPNTEEVKRKKLRRQQSLRFISDKPADKPDKEAPAQSLDERIHALIERGVTDKTAQTLVKDYPDNIMKQVDILDYLIEKDDPKVTKNPAGYLRKSIEDNYTPPENYISKEQRLKINEQQEEQRQESIKQETQKRDQIIAEQKMNAKIDKFIASLSAEEQKTLKQQAKQGLRKKHGEFMSNHQGFALDMETRKVTTEKYCLTPEKLETM